MTRMLREEKEEAGLGGVAEKSFNAAALFGSRSRSPFCAFQPGMTLPRTGPAGNEM